MWRSSWKCLLLLGTLLQVPFAECAFPSKQEYIRFINCARAGAYLDLTAPNSERGGLPPCVSECPSHTSKVTWQCVKPKGPNELQLQFALRHKCYGYDCFWLFDWDYFLQIIGIKIAYHLGIPFVEVQGAALFWPLDHADDNQVELMEFFISRRGENDFPHRRLQAAEGWHDLHLAFRIDSARIGSREQAVADVASMGGLASRRLSNILGFDIKIERSSMQVNADPRGSYKTMMHRRSDYEPVFRFRGYSRNESPLLGAPPAPPPAPTPAPTRAPTPAPTPAPTSPPYCREPCYDFDEMTSRLGAHRCTPGDHCMCRGPRVCSRDGWCIGRMSGNCNEVPDSVDPSQMPGNDANRNANSNDPTSSEPEIVDFQQVAGYMCRRAAVRKHVSGPSTKESRLDSCLLTCDAAPSCVAVEFRPRTRVSVDVYQDPRCMLISSRMSDKDILHGDVAGTRKVCAPLVPATPAGSGLSTECASDMVDHIRAHVPRGADVAAASCGVLEAAMVTPTCHDSVCTSEVWLNEMATFCIGRPVVVNHFEEWKHQMNALMCNRPTHSPSTTTAVAARSSRVTTDVPLQYGTSSKLRGDQFHEERLKFGGADDDESQRWKSDRTWKVRREKPAEESGPDSSGMIAAVVLALIAGTVAGAVKWWYKSRSLQEVVPEPDPSRDTGSKFFITNSPQAKNKEPKPEGLLGRYKTMPAKWAEAQVHPAPDQKDKRKKDKKERKKQEKEERKRAYSDSDIHSKRRNSHDSAGSSVEEDPFERSRGSNNSNDGRRSSKESSKESKHESKKGKESTQSGTQAGSAGTKNSAPSPTKNSGPSATFTGTGTPTAGKGQTSWSSPTNSGNTSKKPSFFHRSSSAPDFTNLPGSGFQSNGPRTAGMESPRAQHNFNQGFPKSPQPDSKEPPRRNTVPPADTGTTPPQGGPRRGSDSPGNAAFRGSSAPPPRTQGASQATSPEILAEQLTSVREQLSTPERKKHFKELCLKWHPDKNVANQDHATKMFQVLQEKKSWFLNES